MVRLQGLRRYLVPRPRQVPRRVLPPLLKSDPARELGGEHRVGVPQGRLVREGPQVGLLGRQGGAVGRDGREAPNLVPGAAVLDHLVVGLGDHPWRAARVGAPIEGAVLAEPGMRGGVADEALAHELRLFAHEADELVPLDPFRTVPVDRLEEPFELLHAQLAQRDPELLSHQVLELAEADQAVARVVRVGEGAREARRPVLGCALVHLLHDQP
mmetsp:Transcript_65633/g.148117  ORF Transcript_65633/g.148117 Transcript_65633/m.148117 type:complete len:214 (+) Transcript_65633:410-1051(+)